MKKQNKPIDFYEQVYAGEWEPRISEVKKRAAKKARRIYIAYIVALILIVAAITIIEIAF